MEGKQQLQRQVDTKTKTSIYVSVLMIGAFLAGMAILFMLPQTTQKSDSNVQTVSTITPATANPMTLADITLADMSANPPQDDEQLGTGTIEIKSLTDNSTLGTFPENEDFTDGITLDDPAPVKIRIYTATHTDLYITLQTNNNLFNDESTSDASSRGLFGIPAANAQVEPHTRQIICLPKKISETLSFNAHSSNPLPGIPIADAQVYPWIDYYVDTEGNAYFDESLTERATTEDCLDMVANNFTPSDITNVTSSKTVDLGEQSYLLLAKSWNTILGFYNSADGYTDHQAETMTHAAPLFIMGGNNGADEEIKTLPTMNLTVTTMQGTATLCLPEQVLESGDWFVIFYDNQGNPYTDMLLQNQIPCDTNPNGCGDGICPDGYWCRNDIECCHKVGGGIECTPPGVNPESTTPSL